MRGLEAFRGGDGNSRATAINNAGEVVGFAEIEIDQGSFITQAFFWTAEGGTQPLSGIGQQSAAFGINVLERSSAVLRQCLTTALSGAPEKHQRSERYPDRSHQSASPTA
jgi:probable HAF family extracellular repeat protein